MHDITWLNVVKVLVGTDYDKQKNKMLAGGINYFQLRKKYVYVPKICQTHVHMQNTSIFTVRIFINRLYLYKKSDAIVYYIIFKRYSHIWCTAITYMFNSNLNSFSSSLSFSRMCRLLLFSLCILD